MRPNAVFWRITFAFALTGCSSGKAMSPSANGNGGRGGGVAGSGGQAGSADATDSAGGSSGANTGGTTTAPATDTSAGGSTSGGSTSAGGSSSSEAGASGCALTCATSPSGTCTAPEVRITDVNLGSPISFGTDETGVVPLALAPMPGGGSRLAWMTGYATNGSSTKSQIHIAELDCDDHIIGTPFAWEAYDFQDIAADANGGVVMLTRDAAGGGTLNCGNVSNLCGTPPSPPDACYDMYMVRYDCAGGEKWAAKLTTSSDKLPPYSTSATGANVLMVWWYQHQGRIAYDGTNYAAYFCNALSISQSGCINIHEGDRMKVVDPSGAVLSGHDGVDWGCSHSGFTRMVWDPSTKHFVMTCKTDNGNRIAQPNGMSTVYPVTLDGAYVGDLVLANGGSYWLTVSNAGSVHLLHFASGAQADVDKTLASANYPHLVKYGEDKMIAAWASSPTGKMTGQVLDASGNLVGAAFAIQVPGHPYQSFRAYPDGSAAYAAVGSSSSTIQVARVLPCGG